MDKEQALFDSIEKAISLSQNTAQLADNLATIEVSKFDDFSIGAQVLANYVSEFQFDWDNEAFDDEEKFAAEATNKIKQMVADIKSGNQYKKIFSTELAYSRLNGDDYSYALVAKKMSAKTINEAVKEKDEIHAQTPRHHPQDKDYILEDARVRVKVIDEKGNTILEERFLLN